jgi:DNA processing protein
MVVPGTVLGGRNRGGHLLIRDGAKVVETANDILQELEGLPLFSGPRRAEDPDQLPEAVDFTVDEVARHTGEPAESVLARLLELELTGRIQRVGGGRFVRVLTYYVWEG